MNIRREYFETVRGFLFDIDGTLLVGDRVVPGARRLMQIVREAGKSYAFVSNGTSLSTKDLALRLRNELKIPVSPSDIVSALDMTVEFLRHRTDNVTVLGAPALKEELGRAGLLLDESGDEADWLVLGGYQDFRLRDVKPALRAVCRGVTYIATNLDRLGVDRDGHLEAGAASVAATIEASVGRKPDLVIGKPSPDIVYEGMRRLDLSSEECVLVGDNIDTDITAGQAAGISTVLVMAGVTGIAARTGLPTEPIDLASMVVDDLVELWGVLYDEAETASIPIDK